MQLVTYLWQIFNLGQKYVLKFCQSHILIYNISVNFKSQPFPKRGTLQMSAVLPDLLLERPRPANCLPLEMLRPLPAVERPRGGT